MKYKVGDTVVIKPWELIKGRDNHYFSRSTHDAALQYTDRSVIMEEVRSDYYEGVSRGTDCGFCFADDDILGHAFEYGDEIEVSDDRENWFTYRFSHYYYLHGSICSIMTPRGISWKYARPIQKESEMKQ